MRTRLFSLGNIVIPYFLGQIIPSSPTCYSKSGKWHLYQATLWFLIYHFLHWLVKSFLLFYTWYLKIFQLDFVGTNSRSYANNIHYSPYENTNVLLYYSFHDFHLARLNIIHNNDWQCIIITIREMGRAMVSTQVVEVKWWMSWGGLSWFFKSKSNYKRFLL